MILPLHTLGRDFENIGGTRQEVVRRDALVNAPGQSRQERRSEHRDQHCGDSDLRRSRIERARRHAQREHHKAEFTRRRQERRDDIGICCFQAKATRQRLQNQRLADEQCHQRQ